eukprot:1336093-Amorphochlora_amoeboformis.AAC.1
MDIIDERVCILLTLITHANAALAAAQEQLKTLPYAPTGSALGWLGQEGGREMGGERREGLPVLYLLSRNAEVMTTLSSYLAVSCSLYVSLHIILCHFLSVCLYYLWSGLRLKGFSDEHLKDSKYLACLLWAVTK